MIVNRHAQRPSSQLRSGYDVRYPLTVERAAPETHSNLANGLHNPTETAEAQNVVLTNVSSDRGDLSACNRFLIPENAGLIGGST